MTDAALSALSVLGAVVLVLMTFVVFLLLMMPSRRKRVSSAGDRPEPRCPHWDLPPPFDDCACEDRRDH